MSSEKPKAKKEKELYESIKTHLNSVFASYITERRYMGAPSSYKENPHLEITAYGHFSEMLKREFSEIALRFLSVEKNLPDMMGFVQKKITSPKELITVEVKRTSIRLFHTLQAKFYKTFLVRNSVYSFHLKELLRKK